MTAWKYVRDGEEHGPVPSHALRELARTGGLLPGDTVREIGPQGEYELVPAKRVERLFPTRLPYNAADCPECGAVVTIRPPVRSLDQLRAEFVPWYRDRLPWLAGGDAPPPAVVRAATRVVWLCTWFLLPERYAAQVAVWYLGCGAVWIPVWFIRDTKPVYAQSPVTCPKCQKSFDALAEGKQLRVEPFDWSKVQKVVGRAVPILLGLWLAFAAVVVLGIGALALAFGAAAHHAATTCRHCGGPKRAGYDACPACGLLQ